LDRVAGRPRARLAGSLRLDLRAHRDELVEDDHRRGVEAQRGEAVRPALPIAEPQSAGPARVTEDGPAGDDVLDEGLARFEHGPAPPVPDGPALRLPARGADLPAVELPARTLLL